MIVKKFLQWSENAGARERAKAANALARAFICSDLTNEDRRAAEAAMALLLDDPSPMVRLGLAEALATSDRAPRAVIHGLVQDQLEVAGLIACCSPVLGDSDLVDLVADSPAGVRRAIAMRSDLTPAVCAALAEVGGQLAVKEMLDNGSARIAGVTLRRIMELFGEEAAIRARLLDRTDLPCDVRQALIDEVGKALAGSALVANLVGRNRVRKVTADACQAATLQLAGSIRGDEMPALVEHLRLDGKLTPAFLMHTLCVGNIDFFAAAISSVSGVAQERVRGLLVDGKRNAIQALYRSGGIDAVTCDVFVSATLLWRRATQANTTPSALKITEELMDRYGSDVDNGGTAELLALVEKLNLNFRRQAAKDYAVSMTRRAA
ncbi:MAG: DUF2336 domain-containing protein [Alphaproteobacteria bacterium]|nr:DUF2336 domain-containing protein [Alphaproteobacteria bacterium]